MSRKITARKLLMLAPTKSPDKTLAPAASGLLRFASACLLVIAVWAIAQGGSVAALGAGLAGALALRGFTLTLTGEGGSPLAFLIDFAVLAALGCAVAPDAALWGAPVHFSDLLQGSRRRAALSRRCFIFRRR